MNKLKALYDVVKTMKDKDTREGILHVSTKQDGQQVWNFTNEFYRDGEGNTKCKLQTEWNWDGNEGRHESTTEFKRKGDHGNGCPFHGGFRHGRHHAPFGGQEGTHGHGFKSKADGFLFLLRMLNKLKAEEQGDQLLFSLELDDEVQKIKEKMQTRFDQNKMVQGPPHHHHPKGKLIKTIMSMEKPEILVNITANKANEVERGVITIHGKNGEHDISIMAEVNFIN